MCICKTSWDIRARCCPYKTNGAFLKCDARLDTIYFHLLNDYDTYKKLDKNYIKAITDFCKKFYMTDIDIEYVIDMYVEECRENFIL